jgi:DNA polymerase-3 subunit chi
MTRIDFYLLNDPSPAARDLALCKLAHKAFALGHRVYVLTGDDQEAQRLDQLLWTFSAGSFVPHELCAIDANHPLTPVLIGARTPPDNFDDVLVSTAPDVPDCFSRFQRVAEVVGGDEKAKQRARDRFRFYRDRGYTLQTHPL